MNPITPSPEIPKEKVLIADAHTLLESSKSWRAGKSHPLVASAQRLSKSTGTQVWNCVVSTFRSDELSFSRAWARLGHNKVWNQQYYVPGINKVTRIKYISDSQSIWTTLLTYPPPLSPRVYTIYQASWLLEYSHKRQGIVITLPIDLSSESDKNLAEMEEKGVRGRYVSVEHIREVDGDRIEWRRLACMDPGGLIPKFWARRKVLSSMVQENLSFFEWLKTLKLDEANLTGSPNEGPRGSIGIRQLGMGSDSPKEFHYRETSEEDTNTNTIMQRSRSR